MIRLSSAEPDTTEEDEVEAPEPDELREGALARITDALGDALLGSHIRPGDELWIRVGREDWVETGRLLRDQLGCRYFGFLSVIDWMPSPFGLDEDSQTDLDPDETAEPVEIEPGYAGGATRFQIFARVADVTEHLGVTVKCDLPDDDLTIDTWVTTYAGAEWHEREAHEMFGVTFAGHPDLRNLYLPSEFEGHPLRKDFPLLARRVKPWPGIVDVEAMPEDPAPPADDAAAASDSPTDDSAGEASS